MRGAVSGMLAALALLVAGCASLGEARGPGEPAVWAVRDADSTIYLFGTIHMRKPGARWGGPLAERALAEASEVWTEVEIDPARDAALQALVARYGIDVQHRLSDLLPPARAAQMREAAAALDLDPDNVEFMKPWLASLTFSVVPMVRAGYDPQSGVDRTVDAIAETAGKHMRWFETGEQQLQFLAGFDQPLQIAMLEDTLDEVGEGPRELEQMEAAWDRGDVDLLARDMVADMKRRYPELYDVILRRRNAAWTDTLAREMAGSGVDFVAVGTAHLVGPDSVQDMLRARGFRVERVRATSSVP